MPKSGWVLQAGAVLGCAAIFLFIIGFLGLTGPTVGNVFSNIVVEVDAPPSLPTATFVPTPTVVPTTTPSDSASSEGGDTVSSAADADVLFVRANETAPNTWTFTVTVEHPDNGWEDYADGWDVVLPDGTVILPDPSTGFTRLLLHPHDDEQPFTRSQSNIVIPADVTEVRVRAHDLVDGFGGREVVVDLTASSGDSFEVRRLG